MTEIFNVETREALYALAAEIEQMRIHQVALVDQLAGDRIPSYIRTPRAASRLTASDTAAEFARLLDQRDLAAYRVVAAVETVIRFWEAQDYDASLALLTRARTEFERAESRITEFRNSHKGELTRHGNRPAA